MTDFVHLHTHTDYSLLDGAAPVQALADKADKLGMKYLAITDHGNMFGVLHFIAACKEHGDKNHTPRANPINPIIGNEFYMAPGSRFEKSHSEYENKYYHLILLAKNLDGYKNLLKLTSLSYTEGFYYKPRIDWEILEKYHDNLVCLSACLAGEIASLISDGKQDEAERIACKFRDLFGDDYYLELQDHGLPEDPKVITGVVTIARKTGIPLVATNDIHYLEKEDWEAQDILMCISTQKKRSDEKRMRMETSEFYFKTGDEMAALFADYPEAIINTIRIAEKCTASFIKEIEDKETHKKHMEYVFPMVETKDLPNYLPDFDIPKGFSDTNEYLRHLTFEGLEKRYPNYAVESRGKEIKDRAEYELDIIIKMGFTGYFLIVADFINWAKEHDIPVGPGRGSGAGSIVAYAVRITDIDPLKYNLLFERFLNPERVSMPDFDVDFANEGREDVIQYVTEKYGKDRVGQIITFGTLKARAVIKDVARVLDIPLAETNAIVNLIPQNPKITLAKALAESADLREKAENPKYQDLFKFARKLEGKNRNSSLHAAGIVIGKTELVNYVPLYRDPKTGGVASQYRMEVIEQQGLVKMDFLGLKTLDVIKNTVSLIRKRGGEYADFDISRILEGDEATYKMLGNGNSSGIFQFESDGMQNILVQAKPTSIAELTALNALYRPGPMDYIPQFIESKWCRQEIVYPDPCLEDILKETYGVIVYQEQVMQVAQRIAGYTLGQADVLRRAMGKKKVDAMAKEKDRFISGAKKQGFKEENAGKIFDILEKFAGYGFNKSHAAAYSIVAYQTAFLKANFPAEFMAATLTNEITATDSLPGYINEARKIGLEIDPPDINRSDRYFSVTNGRIVYGFLGIKGLGEGPAGEIIRARADGPFKNFMDFIERVDIKSVGKKVIELLASVGAFDRFGMNRATLVENLERAVEYVLKGREDAKFGQSGLFDDGAQEQMQLFRFIEKTEWSRAEKLKIEQDLIGFYFSGHPMDEFKPIWEKYSTLNLSKIAEAGTGMYTVVGIIREVKQHQTKNGEIGFSAIADYNGELDLVLFAESWMRHKKLLEVDRVVAIRGKLDNSGTRDKPSLLVDAILNLENPELSQDTIAAFFSHPLDPYREAWEQNCDLNLARTAGVKEGGYTLVGVIRSLKLWNSKSGEMAFSSIEDFNGVVDLTLFSDTWEKYREVFFLDKPVALKGRLDKSKRPDHPSIIVNELLDLEKIQADAKVNPKKAVKKTEGEVAAVVQAIKKGGNDRKKDAESESVVATETVASVASALHIRLDNRTANSEDGLCLLRDTLREKSGRASVFIHIPLPIGETVVRVTPQITVSVEPDDVKIFSHCTGVREVWTE
ncbi:MAG: DNA polymerase III subunit alpha [Treponema sp.]|jgi:DNA polymerase-3 subunit alpha|nr:DNA polymerase III subunit alpha [Treponema sp.]